MFEWCPCQLIQAGCVGSKTPQLRCEEPRLAYNRVAMTSYFQHRSSAELSMVNMEWLQEKTLGATSELLSKMEDGPPRDEILQKSICPALKLWLWLNYGIFGSTQRRFQRCFFFSGPVLDMLGSRSQAHRDENRLAWYHGRRKRGYVEWLRQAAKLSVKELWHLWTRIQRTDTWRSWPWKTTKLNLEWGLNSVCKLFFQQLGAPGLNELIQAAPAIHTGLQTMATMPWFSIHWFSSGYG